MNESKESTFSGKIGAALPVKAVDEQGQFEGYASRFGQRDLGDDVVVAGAFRAALAARPPRRVKMLYQHRPDMILGEWLEMREDANGLFVRGQLFLEDDEARRVHLWMRKGQLDGLSIGYRTIRHEFDQETGVRRLLEIDLREVSLVTFPMLESATVALVKGDRLPTEREFEQWLTREAGFTRSQAKAIIADGYKSLRGARDAAEGDETASIEAIERLTRMLRA